MSKLAAIRIMDLRPAPGFRPLRHAAREEVAAADPSLGADDDKNSFEEGYRLGRADADEGFAAERARYRSLIAACECFQPEPSEALALLIAESVEKLVRVTVGEVAIDGEKLIARAKGAAALVAESEGARVIYLNPDDVALVGTQALSLEIVADETLTRGSLRLEHPTGWIEDGVEVHLNALREQLGLKEPPQ